MVEKNNLCLIQSIQTQSQNWILMVTDLDFADDMALVSGTTCQAHELLERVEDAAIHVCLHMNAKKTKCTVFKQQHDLSIKLSTGTVLEVVEDFRYLGSWTQSRKVLYTIKAMQCNTLTKNWKSTLSSNSTKHSIYFMALRLEP